MAVSQCHCSDSLPATACNPPAPARYCRRSTRRLWQRRWRCWSIRRGSPSLSRRETAAARLAGGGCRVPDGAASGPAHAAARKPCSCFVLVLNSGRAGRQVLYHPRGCRWAVQAALCGAQTRFRAPQRRVALAQVASAPACLSCPSPAFLPCAVVLTKDGQELARLGDEGYFGEKALIGGEPRAATATGEGARSGQTGSCCEGGGAPAASRGQPCLLHPLPPRNQHCPACCSRLVRRVLCPGARRLQRAAGPH